MVADDGVFSPNDEVDEIQWVTVDSALGLLSYDRDRALLRTFVDSALRGPTAPVAPERDAAASPPAGLTGD